MNPDGCEILDKDVPSGCQQEEEADRMGEARSIRLRSAASGGLKIMPEDIKGREIQADWMNRETSVALRRDAEDSKEVEQRGIEVTLVSITASESVEEQYAQLLRSLRSLKVVNDCLLADDSQRSISLAKKGGQRKQIIKIFLSDDSLSCPGPAGVVILLDEFFETLCERSKGINEVEWTRGQFPDIDAEEKRRRQMAEGIRGILEIWERWRWAEFFGFSYSCESLRRAPDLSERLYRKWTRGVEECLEAMKLLCMVRYHGISRIWKAAVVKKLAKEEQEWPHIWRTVLIEENLAHCARADGRQILWCGEILMRIRSMSGASMKIEAKLLPTTQDGQVTRLRSLNNQENVARKSAEGSSRSLWSGV